MYHRFHAPHDGRIEQVSFIHGDTWNVNPIALKRVERLFCKNERAVIRTRLDCGEAMTLVPVAAILVASIRLHFLDLVLMERWLGRPSFPATPASARATSLAGSSMGRPSSCSPPHFAFSETLWEGGRVRAGEALLRRS